MGLPLLNLVVSRLESSVSQAIPYKTERPKMPHEEKFQQVNSFEKCILYSHLTVINAIHRMLLALYIQST